MRWIDPQLILYRLEKKYLNPKQFLILSSIMVGISTGLAAVVLKMLVHEVHGFVTKRLDFALQSFLYVFLPSVGILLTVIFVRTVLKGKLEKGTANVFFTIARKSSLLERYHMYAHVVTSALTVGFGGSAGLEAPIVVTGSAIGSNYGRTYRMSYKDRTLMLACGAASGIAAVFNAPIAGLLFAIEVLLTDISISALIPLIISSVSGALCSKFFLSEDAIFSFKITSNSTMQEVPHYIGLGIIAGIVCIYYARAYRRIEQYFSKIGNPFIKVALGGLALGLLCLVFPPFFGEGYNTIKLLANGYHDDLFNSSFLSNHLKGAAWPLIFIGVICLLKVLAAAITICSGGNGGNFAPSMFTGATLGYFFSSTVNEMTGGGLTEGHFTMVGMAAVVSGVMYAPLSGIFLIAEITGGYELMIPLMIVSAISFGIVKYYRPFPMDKMDLAKKGDIFTHDKDRNILTMMNVKRFVEQDFIAVPLAGNLRDLVSAISKSKRNVFPVVDDAGMLAGLISLEEVREIMFKTDDYQTTLIKDLMEPPAALVQEDEEMSKAMKKFDETGEWNLPVVKNDRYIGMISKSRIFNNYREQLQKQSEEYI